MRRYQIVTLSFLIVLVICNDDCAQSIMKDLIWLFLQSWIKLWQCIAMNLYMKRPFFSFSPAVASSSVTILSNFSYYYFGHLIVVRCLHFIGWIDINLTIRILSFVIFLVRLTKIRLPWELLICFWTVSLITFWPLSFIVMNSLVQNFNFFWLRIIVFLWLLINSCAYSLLSKDTLDFQVCSELLLN